MCIDRQVYEKVVLDKVKDSNAIADGRQQTCAIGAEAEVSSPVHGTEQVGKLSSTSVHVSLRIQSERAHLEISLHLVNVSVATSNIFSGFDAAKVGLSEASAASPQKGSAGGCTDSKAVASSAQGKETRDLLQAHTRPSCSCLCYTRCCTCLIHRRFRQLRTISRR